jgi:hypothetical protein
MTHPDHEAFPSAETGGLTKREWMATMLLAGMNSNGDISRVMADSDLSRVEIRDSYIQGALTQSDELIAALNKSKPK